MVRALKKTVAKNKTEIGWELCKAGLGVVFFANYVNVNFVFLPLMSN